MLLLPPGSPLTYTLFPSTTLFRSHDKCAFFIDRSAVHWITRPFLYRKRLAREHRFVESGPAFHDRAINRHSPTRLDAKAVARAHEIKRDSALPARKSTRLNSSH